MNVIKASEIKLALFEKINGGESLVAVFVTQ